MGRSFTWIVGFVTMIWISVPISNALGNTPVAPSDTSPVDNWWNYTGMYGDNFGGVYQKERMVLADIDDDGVVEILAGGTVTDDKGPADFFLIASHRPSVGDYPIDYVSPAIFGDAEIVTAADIDGDGIWEIFLGNRFGTLNGDIQVLSGSPPTPERYLDSSLLGVTAIRFFQPAGDSNPWLIASDIRYTTVIFDTGTWDVLTEIPYGATEFEVGDVTGDGTPEIVYSTGEVVSFDGITSSLLYTFAWGASTDVELIQLDGDPGLEMVSGASEIPIRAWNYGDPTPIWELPYPAEMVRVADVTGEGGSEIILITEIVTCIDPATQTLMWTYEPTGVGSEGIGSFAAADIDSDGSIEMVLGTGIDNFDPNAVFVVDAETQTLEWRSYEKDRGHFGSVQIGDLDDHGDTEIVFASRWGEGGDEGDQWEGGWIHIMDSATHEELYHAPLIVNNGWHVNLVQEVRIADADNDGDTELVAFGQLASSTGYVVVYDGSTMASEAEYQIGSGTHFRSVELADVDNDGNTEIVGSIWSHDPTKHDQIWVMNGATGVVEWTSGVFPGYLWGDIEIGNLDSDPALEISVISNSSTIEHTITVIDGVTHDAWASSPDNFSALATMDLDDDGRDTLIVGTESGEVLTLDDDGVGGFAQTTLHQVVDYPIMGMDVYRHPVSDEPRFALTSGDGRLIGFDPATPSVVWQSEPILKDPGSHDAIAVAPISTDTGTMFLVGGKHTVYQFGGVREPGSLALAAASYSAPEGGGTMTVTVSRLNGDAGDVSVAYETHDQTAVNGEDYTGVSGSLSWGNGDTTDRTVAVSLLDDAMVEGPEDFRFTLSDVIGGRLGSPAEAVITIEDDDSSTVQFTVAGISVDETAGTVALSVNRTGDTSTAGSVSWATADDSALAGEDYTAASGALTWASGDGDAKVIQIAILDDALLEGDESFTVELSDPGGNAFLGDEALSTVTILSEDLIDIVYSTMTYTADEGAGNAVITVWRTGAANGAVTVDFATDDGTATAGSDYATETGTLIWADGDTTPKTFQVILFDDSTGENDETVLLELANPTGGATIGTPESATLTIEDNDGTALQFTVASSIAGEAEGSFEISVERVGSDTSGVASIDFATSDGTALTGIDYVAVSGTLTWVDGETTDKIFTVAILNDNLVEDSEDLGVTLSNPAGNATLGTPAQAALTITDDDGAEIPINTETNGPQTRPDVAMAPDGSSVVVWESYLQDGAGWGIFGQRFDAAGAPDGLEFQVNSTTGGDQRFAAAAMAPDGGVMIVWRGSDGAGEGIRGRRFNASGTPLTADFVINTTADGDQDEPDVAIDGSGAALVLWQSDRTGDLEIRGRSYNPSGSPTGAEFAVNTTSALDQQLPSVAGSGGGGFAAVWQSTGQDGPAEGVIARLFASNGTPLGAEIGVNEWTSGSQVAPDIGQAADGSFVAAWEDMTHQDGMGSSIRARRFSPAGVPLGGDFQLNTHWMDDQMRPRIASDGAGTVTVTWESADQDGSDLGIYSRSIGADGSLITAEVRFNSFVAGIQYRPAVARSNGGAYWVVWASGGQDGSGDGIFGVFGAAPPSPEVFADGFESGDDTAWSSITP